MNTLYETPEKTLEELKDLCTRTVPPADVYAAIDGVGLWLGPNFQVASCAASCAASFVESH